MSQIYFNPNFVLEGVSDVSVLGSRGVEEKCRRTRGALRLFFYTPAANDRYR